MKHIRQQRQLRGAKTNAETRDQTRHKSRVEPRAKIHNQQKNPGKRLLHHRRATRPVFLVTRRGRGDGGGEGSSGGVTLLLRWLVAEGCTEREGEKAELESRGFEGAASSEVEA
jgi:hypothetical protein